MFVLIILLLSLYGQMYHFPRMEKNSAAEWVRRRVCVFSRYRARACFLRRERQSAIMAMNSLLVGFPLMLLTV